jgi:16S rRNA G966 N2-methylase RsmD
MKAMDERREYPVPLAVDDAIAEFLARHGRPYDPETDDFHREPFVADLREGKNDQVYNVHSYHTKVPPRAIIPYILHYTEPGDIVLDPFCGSGMTGVAAMMCAKPPKDLLETVPQARLGGRRVILNDLSPAACHIAFHYSASFSLGPVRAEFERLLRAAAAEESYLYPTVHFEPACGLYDPRQPEVSCRMKNPPKHSGSDRLPFPAANEASWELVERRDVERALGPEGFAATLSTNDASHYLRMPADITYTVWSDVYKCEGMVTIEEHSGSVSRKTGRPAIRKVRRPRGCGAEIVLWNVAVDATEGSLNEEFGCPNCGQRWKKIQLKRIDVRPVLVSYRYTGLRRGKGAHAVVPAQLIAQRPPSAFDLDHIAEIASRPIPWPYPEESIDTKGPQYNRNALSARKVRTLADFYTHRNLRALASLWAQQQRDDSPERQATTFLLTSAFGSIERMTRYRFGRGGNGWLPGQLYFPSLAVEENIFDTVRSKAKRILQLIERNAELRGPQFDAAITCSDSGQLNGIGDGTIDYIFCDPPFGSNIYYSEVNWLYECWLGMKTDRNLEAVVHRKNDRGTKTIEDYAALMERAFSEMFRVLKPGRYATVEFNNSDGSVFEAIKRAVRNAGFEIENMVFLDKVQKTFKQVKGGRGEEDVVGHDVIFNVRKPLLRPTVGGSLPDASPADGHITHIIAGEIRRHLAELPNRIRTDPSTYSDEHRTTPFLNTMLMTTLIPQGVNVEQLNLPFIESVCARFFKKVDNRWYLPEQVVGGPSNSKFFEEEIVIADETTAIQWLHRFLGDSPMRIGELRPHWMRATVKLTSDLSTQLERILRENFWLDRATRRWRIPTSDELAQLHNVERERACHDAERFLSGKMVPAPADRDVLSWIGHLYDAAALLEEEAQGLVEPGEQPAIPPEAIDYYGMMPQLLQSVLKENVDRDAYTRASRQCRAAARKLEEREAQEHIGDQASGRQGLLFD